MIEILLTLLYPYLWSGTPETGYFQVFFEEVEYIDWCGHEGTFSACYVHDSNQTHTIMIAKDRSPFEKDTYNCNTLWDHEYWHSHKISHGEAPLTTC